MTLDEAVGLILRPCDIKTPTVSLNTGVKINAASVPNVKGYTGTRPREESVFKSHWCFSGKVGSAALFKFSLSISLSSQT